MQVSNFYNEIIKGRENLIYYTPNSMSKIFMAKLLDLFLIVLLISVLLNILDVLTGYIPFLGLTNYGNYINGLTLAEVNSIKSYSVLWNTSYIIQWFMILCLMVITYSVFLKSRRSGWLEVIILFNIIFVVMNFLQACFVNVCPLKLIIDNGVMLKFQTINSSSLGNSWFL